LERIGQQLGNYRLVRLLGTGGFADVYLGQHIYLQMPAAIKVLSVTLTPQARQAFLNEAQTLVQLHHRHIVPVHDFGFDAPTQTPFIVMEYAPYGTLRDLHPEGSILPYPALIAYLKQIAAALQCAHDAKVIHRDVKPANIMLDRDNQLLLGDFGIAATAHSTASLKTHDRAGTAAYMSPEQFEGKPRPASDQYALGIMVYEWLCGARPFSGDSLQLMRQHLDVPPPPLREKRAEIPATVEQVVLKALSKDPHQRFPSVQAFVQELTLVCLPHRTEETRTLSSAVVSEQPQPTDAPSNHAFAGPPSSQDPAYFTLLDIGSTSVRAAILTVEEGKAMFLGKGQYPQQSAAMKAGCDFVAYYGKFWRDMLQIGDGTICFTKGV
jgi:serine/threonine protein kinase